jgi:hypothetical protein
VSVALALAGFGVTILGLKRSGDALGIALDRGNWAWFPVVAWGVVGWSAAWISAGAVTLWIGSCLA